MWRQQVGERRPAPAVAAEPARVAAMWSMSRRPILL